MESEKKETEGSAAEEPREKVIERVSGIGIAVNLVIAAAKVALGALTASVAISAEGMNNATDAMTSVLTLLGTKLAGKHPDEKHPFGYGRIEYLTSLVVAVLILVTGVEMLISSVKLILAPEPMELSALSLAVVAVSAVIKFLLGTWTIRQGRKVNSGALEGVGIECRNDSFISLVTLLSAGVFLWKGLSLDAYAGVLISLVIVKAGAEVLLSTVSELLGRPGEEELAKELYKKVRGREGIVNAADLMLHNYGPGAWSGSVNVEMDRKLTVEEVYRILHPLQLEIMHEKKVTMVFGIYAVDNDREEAKLLRTRIASFVREHEHVKSYHAVYIEPETEKIYCDLIVDYQLRDWDALRAEFLAYLDGFYPGRPVELTIETEFV